MEGDCAKLYLKFVESIDRTSRKWVQKTHWNSSPYWDRIYSYCLMWLHRNYRPKQGLVFSSLILTMLVLVRLKLVHESSRIHFRGLRVYEEGRRRRKVFAKGFPPYSMLLAAPSKNLEHALSQMSSTKRYMSRIQNYFRCVHNAIWCDFLRIYLIYLFLLDNQQNGAWTMWILTQFKSL